MTNAQDTKLPASMTWLFAFGSIAAGIGASYAASGLGQKATAAIYFAIVAIGGFCSTYLTNARTRTAIVAFLLAGAVAAVSYFFLVDAIFHTATSAMTTDTKAVEAGAKMGKIFGVFVAVIVFLETLVAGIGGAVAGGKSRGAGGLSALGAMARSAR